MPGRTSPFQTSVSGMSDGSDSYRYGFNGKENDFEPKNGQGTQQDYGMRIYDPRLGKFLSVDPLMFEYAMLTPYQFASNRPIDGIDLDGLEYHQNARPGEDINGYLTPAKDNTAIALTDQQVLAALSKKAPPPPPISSQQTFIGQGGTLASPEYKMAELYHPYIVPGFDLAVAYGEYKKTGEISYSSLGFGLLSILPAEKLISGGVKFLKGIGGDVLESFSKKFSNQATHLTEMDIKGAIKDIFGKPVEINGKVYNHLQEVEDALRGMGKELNNLNKAIDSGKFSDDVLEKALQMRSELQKSKDAITDVLNAAKKAAGEVKK